MSEQTWQQQAWMHYKAQSQGQPLLIEAAYIGDHVEKLGTEVVAVYTEGNTRPKYEIPTKRTPIYRITTL